MAAAFVQELALHTRELIVRHGRNELREETARAENGGKGGRERQREFEKDSKEVSQKKVGILVAAVLTLDQLRCACNCTVSCTSGKK